MLKLEFLIIIIGLTVFLLQNKVRNCSKEVSRKIVYWTVMFFISLSFNTILFTNYGDWYNINTYLNANTFIILLAILIGFILIQLLSPLRAIKKFFSKITRSNKISQPIEDNVKISSNIESKYERQLHFETFLETICWIGFIALIALESYIAVIGTISSFSAIENNFALVICLIIMLTLPITLRQILFYLFNIRTINKTSLTTEQISLQEKLQKNNIRL